MDWADKLTLLISFVVTAGIFGFVGWHLGYSEGHSKAIDFAIRLMNSRSEESK